MNPTKLRLRNVRRFAELDLELPATRTAILGSNGAGKSTVLDSIEVALFGGDLAAMLSIDATLPELEIELTFEHHGSDYRVRRGYSARGARGKATLDFEESVIVGEWNPLTRETIAATQELICETLRLTRQTYRASAYMAQGDSAAFTEASPRDRKAVLAEVLALADYDQLLVRARLEKNQHEAAIARTSLQLDQAAGELEQGAHIASDLAETRGQLAAADARHATLKLSVAAAAEQVSAKREAQARHEAAAAARAACERAVDDAQRRADDLDRELGAISGALEARPDLAIQASELDALEAQRDELAAARQRAVDAYRQREQAEHHLARERSRLEAALAERDRAQAQQREAGEAAIRAEQAESPVCHVCLQPVADEARERSLAVLRARVAELAQRETDLNEAARITQGDVARAEAELASITVEPVSRADLDAATQRVDAARAAQRRLAELDAQAARLSQLERDLALQRGEALALRRQGLADAQAEVARHAAAAAGYDEARRQHALLEHEAREAATIVSETTSRVARLEAQAERLEQVEAQVAGWRRDVTQAQAQLDVTLALERAFGRDGIPTMIVENAAIPQIEMEANRILVELDTVYSVELRTQRALKSSDGVRETLDITVQTPDGERPYESFSGGERGRLNIALRIALARLLAHRRGAEIRLLAIDEPEGLDAAGAERLAQVLDGLGDDFDVILLVTHQEAMRDAFDSTITIVGGGSTGEPSSLAGAPSAEPVAAP